jgi:hypothetical protein
LKQNLCIKCKGKGLCGRPLCPILEKFKSFESISSITSNGGSVFGASPPAVFVGRYGYPQVSAGPMIPPLATENDAPLFEDPKQWLGMKIEDIISRRSQLVRANTHLNIRNFEDNPLLLKSQELALSKKPVDTEAWFSKPLQKNLRFDDVLTPMGPSGTVEKLDIVDNPKVPKKVDYLAYDTDALAKDAISELYHSSTPTGHITRLLSIGLLGKDRCLVPTRWSITAVDDMAGKDLLKNIRDYSHISDITLFSGGSFGNHFEILLMPRSFSFELIEMWMPKAVWSGDRTWISADYEDTGGKKKYSNLAGGYYAARLGALEYLNMVRRQAAVFMVREIRPDYWAPLGVWVVREAARQALKNPPQTFDSISPALSDMSTRLRTPYSDWKPEAKMLSDIQFQKTLDSFL